MSSLFGRTNVMNATQGVQDKELVSPPTDSISSVRFCPVANYLAVGSWDGSIRMYGVQAQGNMVNDEAKAMYSHSSPVLDVCWSPDGSKVYSASADNTARVFDIQTGQDIQIAQHDAPVRSVRFQADHGFLLTGSWDKTVKIWDPRSPGQIGMYDLPERCYAMDCAGSLLAVATADRHVMTVDFRLGSKPMPTSFASPLKWQTRALACWNPSGPSADPCVAVGSIEGRTGFHFMTPRDNHKNFTFRCHRQDSVPSKKDQSLVYAVNDISFHPIHGTFTTCGSDGTLSVWDKDARSRLMTLPRQPTSITSSSFSYDGKMLAYGVSYDWHKGCHTDADRTIKVMVHAVGDDEMKRKLR
ncbi:Poly(A)+ RNA export protein [Flagelloscypha sp. PMI_526]|nr:Poly(A)+ RNA export protein [Flagelloscypha sp. PMI_526]